MNFLTVCAAILVWGAAQLASGALITGTIRLPGGGPAAGVRVAAMVVPGVRLPGTEASVLERIAQTDSNGRYQLDGIPPGRYFIAAGPLSSPTFHPGTLTQSAATIVTVSQDRRTLTGIDFALNAAVQNPPVARGGLVGTGRATGQLLTEDRSPLPGVPMRVSALGHGSPPVAEDGSFYFLTMTTGTGRFVVEGLPPGYLLKSVGYGGGNFDPGSVLVDGKSPPSFILTLGFQPVSTLQRVTARGKFVNIARELNAASLSLVSTIPSGPTFEAQLQPDRSFEFSSIPVGAYRAGVRDATGNAYVSSVVTVIGETVSNLKIDLRDNPFPEFEDARPARSPFTGGKQTKITGVVTQRLTRIGKPDVAYFRMDVKDESTGAVTPWAIHVAHEWQAPRIVIGETLVVPGTVSTDGTNRLSAEPF